MTKIVKLPPRKEYESILADISPIVRDVPLPGTPSNMRKYPIDLLEVGDSFSVKRGTAAASMRISAINYKKRNPEWDYVTRTEGDRVRIWRTK